MNKKTYVEIFNLIDDTARYFRAKEQEHLDGLSDDDQVINGHYVEKVAKAHKKAKEYEALLERFENEVEEPES